MKAEDARVTYIGETEFRGTKTRFGIHAVDRDSHCYVLGKTGMGKSTLIENMAIQDIKAGEGVIFIDPHGASAEKILEHIPEERVSDVVYFNPQDREHPLPFNILSGVESKEQSVVVEGLVRLFQKLWADEWTGKTEYVLKNTIAALFAHPNATILDINRMFTDPEFRKEVVYGDQENTVRAFWMNEFSKYASGEDHNELRKIVSNVHKIVTNPFVSSVVKYASSSFTIKNVVAKKKIFIANLSKGVIGEEATRFLGGVLITQVHIEALSRGKLPERNLEETPRVMVYIDEVQSISNHSFVSLFSDARKYKFAITVTHQYTGQMMPDVRDAILGNVGTLIVFATGAEDAARLENEFAPTCNAEDIRTLGRGHILLKLMIDGKTSEPFSAQTLPPAGNSMVSYKEQVIMRSREQGKL